MGPGNLEEFKTAMKGREPLEPFLRDEATGLSSVTPEQLREAAAPHLSDVDAAALTGELAEHMHATIAGGIASGAGANVAGADAHLLEQEGHLTLFANRIGDIQAWLAEWFR